MTTSYIVVVGLTCSILAAANNVMGQGMAVNTTGAAADASAMLDVSTTSKGVLVPRMTTAQKRAIASPATGLLVYQTDSTAGFYYYDGSSWPLIGGASSSGTPAATVLNSSQTLPNVSGNYVVNGAYTITLPTSPSPGIIIKLCSHYGATFNFGSISLWDSIGGAVFPPIPYTFGGNWYGYTMTAIFDGTYWAVQAVF